jgi:hypothetical protein
LLKLYEGDNKCSRTADTTSERERGNEMNCDVCLKPNKTLYEVITCGKQELWCIACKDYELGKESEVAQ